jgi:hypothetical protein
MTQHLSSRFDLQSEALVGREGAKSVCCQSTVLFPPLRTCPVGPAKFALCNGHLRWGGIVTVQHLQFALTNAAGLHETIHQFVISESRLHLRPFCPSPSPVTICALMSCPAAWHAADPFIVENLIGLIHEGIF